MQDQPRRAALAWFFCTNSAKRTNFQKDLAQSQTMFLVEIQLQKKRLCDSRQSALKHEQNAFDNKRIQNTNKRI